MKTQIAHFLAKLIICMAKILSFYSFVQLRDFTVYSFCRISVDQTVAKTRVLANANLKDFLKDY